MGRGLRTALAAACAFTLLPSGLAAAAPAACPGAGAPSLVVRDGGALESAAFDGAGRLLYGDLSNNRLRAVDAPGAAPRTVARVTAPGGIAALPGGDVVVASGNAVSAFLPRGASVLRVDPAAGAGAASVVADGLIGANGLARAADGSIFTSDPVAGAIDRVWPDGRVQRRWRRGGTPNGLAVSADGATLFANLSFEGRIVAIDIATGATRTVARAPADRRLAVLDGLAIDGVGNLYATAYLAGEVWRITPDGAICALARGLRAPTAVAVQPPAGTFSSTTAYVTTLGAVRAIPGAVPAPPAS